MNRIVVKTQDADARISRHIYGHFSEHLGRCIYGGFWMGNDPEVAASIPNTRGFPQSGKKAGEIWQGKVS
jgi:alpha-N-arabinofuranosidase